MLIISGLNFNNFFMPNCLRLRVEIVGQLLSFILCLYAHDSSIILLNSESVLYSVDNFGCIGYFDVGLL